MEQKFLIKIQKIESNLMQYCEVLVVEKEIKDKMFKKALKAQENASFSLTNCAERSAIFTAISEGKRKIEAVLIVSSTETPVTPCGACRQVINEFADGEIEIIMMTEEGKEMSMSNQELLPGAFSDKSMEKKV